jgi:glycerophosphoryl diester phosphodiesterase
MSMRIIGHRGASAAAPENTRVALEQALAAGAAGAEIDVRVTADGVVVLLHDDKLDRTTNACGQLRARSFGSLGNVDAGSWFSPAFAGEPLPTLSGVLQEWPGDRRLFVELKDGPELLGPLCDALRDHRGKDIVLLAFDGRLLQRAGAAVPGWPRYHNVEVPVGAPMAWLDAHLREALSAGWQGLSLGGGWCADWPARLHAAGLGCAVWTVDDAGIAQEMDAAGVDDLMTNDPVRMLRSFG